MRVTPGAAISLSVGSTSRLLAEVLILPKSDTFYPKLLTPCTQLPHFSIPCNVSLEFALALHNLE